MVVIFLYVGENVEIKMQTIIIFSGIAVIKGYWRGIHTALQVIFKCVIPFDSKILFLDTYLRNG